MKKLVYIAVAILTMTSAMSCTPKRYLVIENQVNIKDTYRSIDGTLYDLYIQCYVDNEPADIICVESVKPMTKSNKILLPRKTTKVNISYNVAPESFFEEMGLSPKIFRQELVGYRFIDERITVVRFDNNTMSK